MNREQLHSEIKIIVEDETGDYFPVIVHETDLLNRLTDFVEGLVAERGKNLTDNENPRIAV
jgi:hypothetical protein